MYLECKYILSYGKIPKFYCIFQPILLRSNLTVSNYLHTLNKTSYVKNKKKMRPKQNIAGYNPLYLLPCSGITTITFVKAIFTVIATIANILIGVTSLDQTWILSSSNITLSGVLGLRDFQIVGKNQKFFEAKCAVGVDAVIHGWIVADLKRTNVFSK